MEGGDAYFVGGNSIDVRMGVSEPGDWIRVVTKVCDSKWKILHDSGVPGEGIDAAPGLQKCFNPNSQAADNAGKK